MAWLSARWRRYASGRVWARRGVIAVLLALATLCAAGPAWAHATLEGSTPAPDQTLAAPPRGVALRFDEAVTVLPNSVRVYGPDGQRADDGVVTSPGESGSTVAVGLTGSQQGTYLVSWRVISADSHPVSGAFTFNVGSQSAAPSAKAEQNNPVVAVALGISRWLGYLGAALLIGGATFMMACWPSGWRVPSAWGLLRWGWGLAVAGALGGFAVKGPYDAALGLGAIGRPRLLQEVLASTYGRALVARLVFLVVAACLVWLRPRVPRGAWEVSAGLAAVAVLVTYTLTGHAVVPPLRALAVAADLVHVAAMSVWVGGAAVLFLVVLRAHEGPAAGLAVDRFSPVARWAVVSLVVSGGYQAWREVGSWGALPATTYGRELLVKLAVVVVVLLAALASQSWVRRQTWFVRTSRAGLAALRRSVAVETVGLAVVLAVTAALVATEPATTAYHPAVSTTLRLGPDTVAVHAVPAGDRRMLVSLLVRGQDGEPTNPAEVTAALNLRERGIGPLQVVLVSGGTGEWTGVLTVPVAGDWDLTVTVRTTAIDEFSQHVRLRIP